MLRTHLFTVVVAASYLTLGLFAPQDAERLWWAYGIVTFVLALANVIQERRTGCRF